MVFFGWGVAVGLLGWVGGAGGAGVFFVFGGGFLVGGWRGSFLGWGDFFGGRNVSGIIGILYTSVAFGTLIGPSAAGFAFDLSHSYTLPILASAAANVAAAVIVAVTSKGRRFIAR